MFGVILDTVKPSLIWLEIWYVEALCYLFRLKDGNELEESAKYRMRYHDGVASLFINGLEVEDAGQITCKATNNMGSVKTKANLTIEGKYIVLCKCKLK